MYTFITIWYIMKKIALLFLIFISGCSSKILLNTDPSIVQSHPKPLVIYEIGDWNSEYVVLNLVDARGEHFNIRVRRHENLTIGAEYNQ